MKFTLLRVLSLASAWLIVSTVLIVWMGFRKSRAMGQDTFFAVAPIRTYFWFLIGPPLVLLAAWLWLQSQPTETKGIK